MVIPAKEVWENGFKRALYEKIQYDSQMGLQLNTKNAYMLKKTL